MIDIHSHILPGTDDGSSSWAMTLEMCRIAEADGIRHVVASPHANSRYAYDREEHAESLDQLREEVPGIRFSLGCDFHLSQENIWEAVRNPERFVIDSTPYLLVEFGDFQLPRQMMESLFHLHSAGFRTIVSHPERYPIVEQYPDLPQQFFDQGSAIQITASALTGDWGRKPQKTCESLLKKGLVSFIATDAHDSKRRKPALAVAYKRAARIVGESAARTLVHDNPRSVISNQPLMGMPSTSFQGIL